MSGVKLYLLGTPRLDIDGQPARIETRKVIALLAYLAVMGESYRRDSLVNLFWPEYDLTHGRAVLRRTLSSLNAVLPKSFLVTDRETIGLNSQADLWVDVREFHRHLDQCRRHGHAESDVCPSCQVELNQAIDLFHDDFMSGFTLADSFNFDDWQFYQTETLRQEMSAALGRLAHCSIRQGDFDTALKHTRRRLTLDRMDEEVHCDLMRLYAWTHQRSAALHQFKQCKDILQSQLGVEPQPETARLARLIEAGNLPEPPTDPARQIRKELKPVTEKEDQAPPEHKKASEKRMVTVLFFEICQEGSPPGEEDVEENPEQGEPIIERWMNQIQPILARYGGQNAGRVGNSQLVVFGLAHTHENDPELALRASLDIVDEARRDRLTLVEGVATGEVFARSEEVPEKNALALSGQAIDVALFLSSQAEAGQIWVDESTYKLSRSTFVFTPLLQAAKRRGKLVMAYQVEHLLPQAQKTRGISGLHAPLVGRQAELTVLQNNLEKVRACSGTLVVVTGEAGVGKTRLIAEFHQLATQKGGLSWLEARCLELSMDVGYWPFLDLLKVAFSWQAHHDIQENREQVAKVLQQLVSDGDLPSDRTKEIDAVLYYLLTTGSESDGDNPLSRLAPDEIRQRIFLALRDYLLALSRQQPLVVVFEDLHWVDPLSLDLIYYLMESLPRSRLMLIAVYRPEPEYRTYHLSTIAERKCHEHYAEIRLLELSQSESHQMVDFLLGDGHRADRIKSLVCERCQGNPFYIEEVIHSLIEASVIYHQGDCWQVGSEFDAHELPASLQNAILGRLDHVEEDYRQILLAAAIIGRVFAEKVLQQAIPAGIDLNKALWELEGRGLIYQERTIPEVEYSFRHVLMQEAIYQNISRYRRKLLHQNVAETIERIYSERLEDHYEQLAYHYEKSGHIQQTIYYLFKAGKKASLLCANEAAIGTFTKGLELLRSLPETLERNRQEIEFLTALGILLIYTRGHADDQVLDTYSQARDLCEKTKDATYLFDVLLGLRRYMWSHGDHTEAVRLSQQMLDLAISHKNSMEQARACMMLGEAMFGLSDYPSALEYCRKGLALCRDQDPYDHIRLYGNDTRMGCQMYIPQSLWLSGYPDQALAELQQSQALLERITHPFSRVMGLTITIRVYQFLDQPQTVQILAEEELKIAREHGFALYEASGLAQLGWSLAAQNQFELGGSYLQQAIEGMHRLHIPSLEEELADYGEILGKLGKVQEGLRAITEGIAVNEKTGLNNWLPELYRIRGQLTIDGAEGSGAEHWFIQAIETARRQKARSWELRAAISLARLWQQQGKPKEAYELLYPIYHWFTEGFGTPDLLAVKKIIQECSE